MTTSDNDFHCFCTGLRCRLPGPEPSGVFSLEAPQRGLTAPICDRGIPGGRRLHARDYVASVNAHLPFECLWRSSQWNAPSNPRNPRFSRCDRGCTAILVQDGRMVNGEDSGFRNAPQPRGCKTCPPLPAELGGDEIGIPTSRPARARSGPAAEVARAVNEQ
jgi:hypothetical protein